MTRNRAKYRRSERTRPLHAAIAGILTMGLVVGFAALAFRAPRGIPLQGSKTLYALLPDGGSLRVHSEVRLRGVRVGEVVSVTPEQGQARIRLRLDRGRLDALPADTKAAVRGQGLLGARYVALEPGTSPQHIAVGSTLPPSSVPFTLGVGDALETFDRQTRGSMRTVFGELGRGMLGRGSELNRAIQVDPEMNRDLQRFLTTSLERPGAVGRLVPSFNEAAAALDDARYDITRMIEPTRSGLAPFAERGSDVRETLETAPGAFAAARRGLDEGRRLLASARALAVASRSTLASAPAGLSEATRMFRTSDEPLARAGSLLRATRPAVPAILRITSRLSPVLKPLGAALDDATPLVSALSAHACDLKTWSSNWRSFVNHAIPGGQGAGGGVGVGPLTALRFEGLFSPEAIAGFGTNEGLLGEDTKTYPAPCAYPPHTYGTGARAR